MRSGVIVLYFSAWGTRSGIIALYCLRVERALLLLCYIFPCVERALALLCYIFCAWNALWRYYVIFPAWGTRSGIIALYCLRVERALLLLCYIFPCVERALALFCYVFCVWNALWRYSVIFAACGTRSGVVVLYFPCVERALVFCVKFISCCNIVTLILFNFSSYACLKLSLIYSNVVVFWKHYYRM